MRRILGDGTRVAVIVASVVAAAASSDSKSGNASNAGGPAPAPPPATQSASWDTHAINGTDLEGARVTARKLVNYCGSHDPHGDTWSKVQSIEVEHRTISDHGTDVSVWQVQAHFPNGWKFDVLHGNTLWYNFDESRSKFFPMKDVSGDVCGVGAERWNAL